MNGSERMKESKSLENLKVEEFMYVSTEDSTKGRKSLVIWDFFGWIWMAMVMVWSIAIACRKVGKIVRDIGIWKILCEILEEETKSWAEPILIGMGLLCLILFWGDEYFDNTNGQRAYIQRSNPVSYTHLTLPTIA